MALTGTKIWIQLRNLNGELILLEGVASQDGVRMNGSFCFQHGLIVERPQVLRAKLALLEVTDSAQTQPASH